MLSDPSQVVLHPGVNGPGVEPTPMPVAKGYKANEDVLASRRISEKKENCNLATRRRVPNFSSTRL